MSLIKIGISGANGRMGQAVELAIKSRDQKFDLVAKLTSASTKEDVKNACKISDVIIDFAKAESLEYLTLYASKYSTNLVVGSTGLEANHFEYLENAAKNTAVVYAPNTSLGANLLEDLSMRAAEILKGYDAEIIEAHHKHKKDSPSGTAIAIGKSIAKARDIDFNEKIVLDRSAKGLRQNNDISISSVRGGGIFGEHEVIFAGDNELFTIGHRALSRSAFAEGAVFAAAWVEGKANGLYSMRDVLNLTSSLELVYG